MKYIFRKACVSMVTGAAYMFGSWMAKHVLDKTIKESIKHQEKQKEIDLA